MNYQAISHIIEKSKKVSIVIHPRPDGDAVGSALALKFSLEKAGKKVHIISPDPIPDFLKWLPGSDQMVIFSQQTGKAKQILLDSDLIFIVDFNRFSRVDKDLEQILEKKLNRIPFIMIDHHPEPDERIPYKVSDPSKASSAELVYEFIKNTKLADQLDEKTATAIYTGILTDTGSFRFDKTSSETHEIVSELIQAGAKNAEIYSQVFDTYSYDKMQLLGEAIRRMKIIPECAVSYIILDKDTLKKFHYKNGDTEGIVNYGLMIDGIKMTVLFTEKPGENVIRTSFRSKGNFNVNEFARKYFNGGGHQNAAGGSFQGSMYEAEKKFVELVRKYCAEIKNS